MGTNPIGGFFAKLLRVTRFKAKGCSADEVHFGATRANAEQSLI